MVTTRVNRDTLVYQYQATSCVTQCRCIVPAHYTRSVCYAVSTNHKSRLRIPTDRAQATQEAEDKEEAEAAAAAVRRCRLNTSS